MIEPGYCLVCHAKTHTACASCGTKKFNDQHTEVEVTWTNGAKMIVGVCVHCAGSHAYQTQEGKQKIAQAHHSHWEEQGAKVDRTVTLA